MINRRTVLRAGASLLIAAVFWTTLISREQEVIERIVAMPIEYKTPVNGLVPIGELADQAKIRVAGTRSAIEDFMLEPHTLKIDLSRMDEGTHTILITAEHLGAAKALFKASAPGELEVNLAKIIKTSVPVEPQLVGKLPIGLTLKRVAVSPPELQALAPPIAKGEKPYSVSPTPVYLNSIQSNTRLFCKIIAPAQIRPVNKDWKDVEVIIEIDAAQ